MKKDLPRVAKRNFYYVDAKTLDLQKMRDHALAISIGDRRNPPEPVMLHYHGVLEVCFDAKHTFFNEGEIEELD